jgi:hypothetical protein
MTGRVWQGPVVAAVVLAGGIANGRAAPPARVAKYREAALAAAVSTFQGMEIGSRVAGQEARAKAVWKKVAGGAKADQAETEHFLLYGKVPGRKLKEVGALLEKEYALARQVLKLEKEDPWTGKLAVYFFTDRRQFTSFVRNVEKRRPEPEDRGSFVLRGDHPHLAAGPPGESGGATAEAQAGEQLASALLTKVAERSLPDWLTSGFARATWSRCIPPRERAAERRRALKTLLAKKASAQDVYDGNVTGEEAQVLRGSLVDYLAYGPGRNRFLPFINGFKPEENIQQPRTTADALKAARIDPAFLNKRWKYWVRRGR